MRSRRLAVALLTLGLVAGARASFALDPLPVTLATPPKGEPASPKAITSPDGIPLAGFDAPMVRAPSSPGAWGGPRKGDEPTLSERVASYAIHCVVDPAKHTVDGSEKLVWKNRGDKPLRTLYFHTYLNAFEGPSSTWMREKHRWGEFRSGVEIEDGEWGSIDVRSVTMSGKPATTRYVQPDGGPATDRSLLEVTLPDAIAPGAEATIDVSFFDKLPRVIARTGYFDSFHLVAQWFPKIAVLELPGERGAEAERWNAHEFHLSTEFYADFGSYDVEIVAPKSFGIGSVGAEVGEPKEGPEGVTHHYHQDDVHDFAFTLWDHWAPPLKGGYDGPGSPHVAVQVLYPPEWESSGKAALQATIDSLRYFSSTLGPYPYKQVTAIVPPFNADEAGGMEYETFFTSIGGAPWMDPIVRYVTVHEFGHGYFMGLLASNEFEEPFLDEGMNEWWDTRMLGPEPFKFDFGLLSTLGLRPPPFSIWDFQHLAGTGLPGRPAPDPLAASSWRRLGMGSYGSVYPHTVVVMHDLEQRLGGDAIARGMKLYYARWHHRHPSAADLREAFVDAAPEHADTIRRYFDEQVYGAEPVDDVIDRVESEELLPEPGGTFEDGKLVERTSKQVDEEIGKKREAFAKEHPGADEKAGGPFPFRSTIVARRHAASVAQTIVVELADGSRESFAWPPGERWKRLEIDRPTKVKAAWLDDKRDVLLDVDKLDDARTRESHGTPATRWTLEGTTWLEQVLGLVSSL